MASQESTWLGSGIVGSTAPRARPCANAVPAMPRTLKVTMRAPAPCKNARRENPALWRAANAWGASADLPLAFLFVDIIGLIKLMRSSRAQPDGWPATYGHA